MNVFLAKNIKSQIQEIPFRSVKDLNGLIKDMKNDTFNSSASRTVIFGGNEIKEIRVNNLDIYYHTKEKNIFIISIIVNF